MLMMAGERWDVLFLGAAAVLTCAAALTPKEAQPGAGDAGFSVPPKRLVASDITSSATDESRPLASYREWMRRVEKGEFGYDNERQRGAEARLLHKLLADQEPGRPKLNHVRGKAYLYRTTTLYKYSFSACSNFWRHS